MNLVGPDIRFIRLDDDLCEELNRQADARHRRVSDLANELIRLQLWGVSEPLAAEPPATE
ncbi:MAG: hypothetical protein JWP63_6954 [Candidatus Solibacter sp.]|jgi:predicted transcriptional regulator|nr:hypothetical protein [Candidatus Solibacter sp.]